MQGIFAARTCRLGLAQHLLWLDRRGSTLFELAHKPAEHSLGA